VGSPSQQTCSETTDRADTVSLWGCDLEECRFSHSSLLWLSSPSAGGRICLGYRNNQASSLASMALCKVKFSSTRAGGELREAASPRKFYPILSAG